MFGDLPSPADQHDGPEPEESQHRDSNDEARDHSSETTRRLLDCNPIPFVRVAYRRSHTTTLTIVSTRCSIEFRPWCPTNPTRVVAGAPDGHSTEVGGWHERRDSKPRLLIPKSETSRRSSKGTVLRHDTSPAAPAGVWALSAARTECLPAVTAVVQARGIALWHDVQGHADLGRSTLLDSLALDATIVAVPVCHAVLSSLAICGDSAIRAHRARLGQTRHQTPALRSPRRPSLRPIAASAASVGSMSTDSRTMSASC